MPVEIGEAPEERYPAPVEAAAYHVAAEGIADAARRGARLVVVAAVHEGSLLAVTVKDDGQARASAMMHVADRVGALGGGLDVEPAALRAEIPAHPGGERP